MSEQFLKACAVALVREHGPKANEIIEQQISGLQTSNPIAATAWWKISKHLEHGAGGQN